MKAYIIVIRIDDKHVGSVATDSLIDAETLVEELGKAFEEGDIEHFGLHATELSCAIHLIENTVH